MHKTVCTYLNISPLFFSLHAILQHDICYLILSTDTCTIYTALNLSVVPCVLFSQMFLMFRNRTLLRYTTSDVNCFLTCTDTNGEAWLTYVSHMRHTLLTGVGSHVEWCSAHTHWSWLIVSSIRRFMVHCKLTSNSAHANESVKQGAICTQGSSPPPHESYWQSRSSQALGSFGPAIL